MISAIALQKTLGPRKVQGPLNVNDGLLDHRHFFADVLTWQINDQLTVKNIGGMRRSTAITNRYDFDGTSLKIYTPGSPPEERDSYLLVTNLTPEQVRETFSTPETVPFWQLPYFINMADRAGLTASGYRLQYQKLLARPFLLSAMVLLAAAFSLRFFRMGGVQKMVLGGLASGFLLYIMSKLTDDLSKAELLTPMIAAWMPAVVGAMTGFVALLYQEDG